MSHHSRTHARWAGLLLGIGLGGFVDGIVLHQIVHWHNMLSAVVPTTTLEGMVENMRADGFFHAANWVATFAGVLLLWRAAREGGALPPTRWFLGLLLMGWGIFNLGEGLVDHHLLELHHVRDVPVHVPAYDYVFLAVSVLLLLIGWWMTRGAVATRPASPPR